VAAMFSILAKRGSSSKMSSAIASAFILFSPAIHTNGKEKTWINLRHVEKIEYEGD